MAKTLASLRLMTLRDVIDRAAARGSCANRESLAQRIGVAEGSLYPWIMGKRLPSDDVMLSLCNLAGIGYGEGLLLLNVWRSSGRTRTAYIKLLARLGTPNILRAWPDIESASPSNRTSKTATGNT